jgi:microcystin degradation protein MlrC
MVAAAREPVSALPREMSAFVQTMDATGPWTPVPLLLTGCPPWGPVEGGFFTACLDRIVAGLKDARPLDGVYIANHGAMVATDDGDPDGTLMAAIRDAVGGEAVVIATLDLHANVSEAMAASTDAIIGYLTNPHVDQVQRGEEAALLMRRMFAGLRPAQVLVRLPLVPPSTTLLTASGPYGDLIDFGQRRGREEGGEIVNVSVFGNFAFSDTAKNGLSVVVTARDDKDKAAALANEIAVRAWNNRTAFTRKMTSIDEAVALAGAVAEDPGRAPVILSDAGDNPGGGGEGRTTWLLAALAAAEAKGVYFGAFFDPELALEAHGLGEGVAFNAVFNRGGDTEFSKRFEAGAEVLKTARRPGGGPSGHLQEPPARPGHLRGAEDRRGRWHYRDRHRRPPPNRRSGVFRDVRPGHRSGAHGLRQVAGPFQGRIRTLVPTGAGLRNRYSGADLPHPEPISLAQPAPPRLSPGPGHHLGAWVATAPHARKGGRRYTARGKVYRPGIEPAMGSARQRRRRAAQAACCRAASRMTSAVKALPRPCSRVHSKAARRYRSRFP